MQTLETYEIQEIILNNTMFEEWQEYLSIKLGVPEYEVYSSVKYLEDAGLIHDLYYDFFESEYNFECDENGEAI